MLVQYFPLQFLGYVESVHREGNNVLLLHVAEPPYIAAQREYSSSKLQFACSVYYMYYCYCYCSECSVQY